MNYNGSGGDTPIMSRRGGKRADSRRSFHSGGTGNNSNSNSHHHGTRNNLRAATAALISDEIISMSGSRGGGGGGVGGGSHSRNIINNNPPPTPPSRAKSEQSLSSIGSASVSASSVYRHTRVTPTLPDGGRRSINMAAAALPPTPPVRSESDSYSGQEPLSSGGGNSNNKLTPSRESSGNTSNGHSHNSHSHRSRSYLQQQQQRPPPPPPSHQDIVPGERPTPPSLSPFFSPKKPDFHKTVAAAGAGAEDNGNVVVAASAAAAAPAAGRSNSSTSSPTSVTSGTEQPPQNARGHRRASMPQQQQPQQRQPPRVPSPQELEDAQRVLMAARQSGMIDDMEMPQAQGQAQQRYSHHHHHGMPFVPPQSGQFHHHLSSLYEQQQYTVNRGPSFPTNVVIHDGGDGRAANTMGRMESEVTLDTQLQLMTASRPASMRNIATATNNNYTNNNSGMQSEDSSLVEEGEVVVTTPQQPPRRGLLNRGGAFVPPSSRGSGLRNNGSSRWSAGGGNGNVDRPVGAPMPSNRTMSSISSYEDDLQQQPPAARPRSRGGSMDDLFETSETSLSVESPKDMSLEDGGARSKQGSKDSRSLGTCSLGGDFLEVFETLRESKAMPIEAAKALKGLSSIKFCAEDFCHLADVDAAPAIVEAMVVHDTNYQVQRWGCHTIWTMSGNAKIQAAFVQAGGLDVVLGAVERFSGDIDLIESALSALSNMAAAKANLVPFIEKGAVEKVVKAMTSNSDNTRIQIKGCGVINNLSMHKSSFKEQILQSGAGEAAVVAMVMHQPEILLQEKALRALRNLCIHCDVNKVEAAGLGASDAAITAMQVHRDEPSVQEEGALLIAVLTGVDENKFSIGDCGGVEVTLRAMIVHSDSIGVVEQSLKALLSLSFDLENTNKMIEIGGIDTVVTAMHGHTDSATVQNVGCAILANFAETSGRAKMLIVDQEALDAIVMAMVLHADNAEVQASACLAVFGLSIEENFKPLLAANVVELTRTAMNNFPEDCGETAAQVIRIFEDVVSHQPGSR
ncbi:MAG: hypothetical protein SGILL_005656 [Bacillariaceae sp.]